MANRYMTGGRSLATAATGDHCAAQLWNPHATKAIYVREVWHFKLVATADSMGIVRSSARGATPTVTVTPDADNAFDRLAVPASAAVLEMGTFGTQPTLAQPYLTRMNLPAAIGAGWMWVGAEPIVVPAGTGLCVATPVAAVMQPADFTFVWDE